jgi:hypothetical protein
MLECYADDCCSSSRMSSAVTLWQCASALLMTLAWLAMTAWHGGRVLFMSPRGCRVDVMHDFGW